MIRPSWGYNWPQLLRLDLVVKIVPLKHAAAKQHGMRLSIPVVHSDNFASEILHMCMHWWRQAENECMIRNWLSFTVFLSLYGLLLFVRHFPRCLLLSLSLLAWIYMTTDKPNCIARVSQHGCSLFWPSHYAYGQDDLWNHGIGWMIGLRFLRSWVDLGTRRTVYVLIWWSDFFHWSFCKHHCL